MLRATSKFSKLVVCCLSGSLDRFGWSGKFIEAWEFLQGMRITTYNMLNVYQVFLCCIVALTCRKNWVCDVADHLIKPWKQSIF